MLHEGEGAWRRGSSSQIGRRRNSLPTVWVSAAKTQNTFSGKALWPL
jgi:hypothetical protein